MDHQGAITGRVTYLLAMSTKDEGRIQGTTAGIALETATEIDQMSDPANVGLPLPVGFTM
jgi:hypothetical protein